MVAGVSRGEGLGVYWRFRSRFRGASDNSGNFWEPHGHFRGSKGVLGIIERRRSTIPGALQMRFMESLRLIQGLSRGSMDVLRGFLRDKAGSQERLRNSRKIFEALQNFFMDVSG